MHSIENIKNRETLRTGEQRDIEVGLNNNRGIDIGQVRAPSGTVPDSLQRDAPSRDSVVPVSVFLTILTGSILTKSVFPSFLCSNITTSVFQ